MMMLAGLGACATVAPPKTASDSFCSLYEPVSYALLDLAEVALAATEGRQVRDDGNKADSALTVRQNDRNNARYDTVCGDPLAKPSG